MIARLRNWPRWRHHLLLGIGILGGFVIALAAVMTTDGTAPFAEVSPIYWLLLGLGCAFLLAVDISLHFLIMPKWRLSTSIVFFGLVSLVNLPLRIISDGWVANTIGTVMLVTTLFIAALSVRIIEVRESKHTLIEK